MIRKNFIYPLIDHKTRVFGSINKVGTVINPTGDWRPYLPIEEYQKVNGVESSACYIEAQQHSIATILEKQYSVVDSDYASRFNALLSEGTEYGGDPIAGAESMRTDGLIPQSMMPFDPNIIRSWDDFHSWKGADQLECIRKGQEFLKKWKLNYDIVIEKQHSLDMKYARLKEKLKMSPVAISVWGEVDWEGNYKQKPAGADDTHLVQAVHVDDENCIWVWDTYPKFLKKLPQNYNPDFGIMWGVTEISNPPVLPRRSLWYNIIAWIKTLFQ